MSCSLLQPKKAVYCKEKKKKKTKYECVKIIVLFHLAKKKKKRLTKGFSCVSKLSIIICHMFIDKK